MSGVVYWLLDDLWSSICCVEVLVAFFAKLLFEKAVSVLVEWCLGGEQEVMTFGNIVLVSVLSLLLPLVFECLGALGNGVEVAARRESILVRLFEGLLILLVRLVGTCWGEHILLLSHCPTVARLLILVSPLVLTFVTTATSLALVLSCLLLNSLILGIQSSRASSSLPRAEI